MTASEQVAIDEGAAMRELLGVIAEALTLPAPVFDDRDEHRDLMRDRMAMVRSLARYTVESGRPDITVGVLRDHIADSPVTYRVREQEDR